MGHLIPAGTGFSLHRNVKLMLLGEPVEPPQEEKVEPQTAEAVLQ
jgi:hypothetical protein